MRSRFFSKRAVPKTSKMIPVGMKGRLKAKIKNKKYCIKSTCGRRSTLLSVSDVHNFVSMGQFWDKIVICFDKKKSKIYLLDQHAAHERIRYSYFKAYFDGEVDFCKKFKSIFLRHEVNNFKFTKEIERRSGKVDVVHLQKSDIFREIFVGKDEPDLDQTRVDEGERGNYWKESRFEVKKSYLEKVEKILKALRIKDYKMVLTSPSNPRIIVKDYPIFFGKFSSVNILKNEIEAIGGFDSIKFNSIPKTLDSILKEKSCKSGVKFNDKLSFNNAFCLIQDLKLCDYPLHCIHGRKTVHVVDYGSFLRSEKDIKFYKEKLKF